MEDIALVGVGAVGGVVASALLACTDHPLELYSRQGFDRLVIKRQDPGAPGRFDTRDHDVRVTTEPDDRVARVRWAILATKAHQTASAAPWLERLCSDRTVVAVLQNGVEHLDRVGPLAGPARVLPVIVDCPATRTAPGRVTCYRAPGLVVPDTPEGRAFAALMTEADIATEVTDDFVSALWRKLCVNVVSGSIPTLCDGPRGVFRHDAIAELSRGLIAECVAVGRAEGAALEDDLGARIVAEMNAGDPDSLTSMLVDRRAGEPLEADSRNGAVVRVGARHGIPTPLNRAVNAILSTVNLPYPG